MTSLQSTRSISAAKVRAAAYEAGTARRAIADLRVTVLELDRDCQVVAATGISAECSRIDALINKIPNPNRPFLSWSCCDTHRALHDRREVVKKLAAELGVEFTFQVANPVTD